MTINCSIAPTPEYEAELYTSMERRGIPRYMHESVAAYIIRGRPVGDFLAALFSNDLMEAFSRADDSNVVAIGAYVKLLYNDSPHGCYGSPQAYRDWLKHRGLTGLFGENLR